MVLVPIGESIVDINVDGNALISGDVINDDTTYNLTTDYTSTVEVNGTTEYTNQTHNQDTTYDVNISTYSTGPDVLSLNESGSGNGTYYFFDLGNETVSFSGTYDFTVAGSISAKVDLVVDGTVVVEADSDKSGSFNVSGSSIYVNYSTGNDDTGTNWTVDIDADLGVGSGYNVDSVSEY